MTKANLPQPSGERVVSWVLLVAALVGTVLVARRGSLERPARAEGADPLSLVPLGPRLLVTADLSALISVAGGELARLGGDKLLGLREVCGFEPMLTLERAALSMPFESEDAASRGSDFALIAETTLEPERGLQCAEAVINRRGGSPVRTRLGAFSAVRDVSKPVGEVAIRTDGMFVLSGGRYFRDVMDVAAGSVKGDEAAVLRTRLHRSIRDKLGPAQLQLTLLPEASSLLHGVLALGLGLELRAVVHVRGLVVCVSPAACSSAHDMLEAAQRELAQEPSLSGLSGLKLEQRGDRLEIAGTLQQSQLGPLLALLVAQ